MTTNQDAYDRIRAGKVAANLGYSQAQTVSDANRFLDLYYVYDDELDRLVADELMKSSGQYKPLTQALKGAKKDLEDIIDNIQKLVQTTEAALKIVTIFSKIVAII